MMSLFQNIKTERLTLSPLTAGDIDSMAEMHADPVVMQHAGGGEPLSKTENWRLCAQLIGHWHIRNYGMYAIYLKDNKNCCGMCGLHYPYDYPGPEIGWRLFADCWGNGYAIEAARAVRAHAFHTLHLNYVYHLIEPDNARSRKLAEKLGATLLEPGDARYPDDPGKHLIYITEKPDCTKL
jgi:RimJ/RimL family protein N-acetyltransferase